LLPVCATEFAFDAGAFGFGGSSAEAVGEAASHCIERPKETDDSVTAGEADAGTVLWLVCAVEFAFDPRTAGNAGRFAAAVGEAASGWIERPKENSDRVTAGILATICCAAT
jgi:hypothetical protein